MYVEIMEQLDSVLEAIPEFNGQVYEGIAPAGAKPPFMIFNVGDSNNVNSLFKVEEEIASLIINFIIFGKDKYNYRELVDVLHDALIEADIVGMRNNLFVSTEDILKNSPKVPRGSFQAFITYRLDF